MLINDFLHNKELKKDTIVPIDDFLVVIADKTGWDVEEFLEDKDMGDVEKSMSLKAKRPNNLNEIPIKRGKSRNAIYNFKSVEERLYEKAIVTNWISQ